MQEKIIAASGILVAVICSVVGWWMENGPSRRGQENTVDSTDEPDENAR